MRPPVPETDRMVMRRASWPDVDDVVALTTDAEVMGFDDSLPLTPARVLAEEMPRLMAHQRRTDQLGCWVARERTTAAFLGWFMMTPVEEGDRTVRLGYRLRRRAWEQGYGIEGMLQLIEMARAAEMTTVIATTPADNDAAGQVMRRVGLQLAPAGHGDLSGSTATGEHWQLDVSSEVFETVASPA
jgi:RimJ/RimL family protein N-acetyltransferase